jgi:hypothetical protein
MTRSGFLEVISKPSFFSMPSIFETLWRLSRATFIGLPRNDSFHLIVAYSKIYSFEFAFIELMDRSQNFSLEVLKDFGNSSDGKVTI